MRSSRGPCRCSPRCNNNTCTLLSRADPFGTAHPAGWQHRGAQCAPAAPEHPQARGPGTVPRSCHWTPLCSQVVKPTRAAEALLQLPRRQPGRTAPPPLQGASAREGCPARQAQLQQRCQVALTQLGASKSICTSKKECVSSRLVCSAVSSMKIGADLLQAVKTMSVGTPAAVQVCASHL